MPIPSYFLFLSITALQLILITLQGTKIHFSTNVVGVRSTLFFSFCSAS
jgi:hypothetical protein